MTRECGLCVLCGVCCAAAQLGACEHTFCRSCLTNWCKEHLRCPLCVKPFTHFTTFAPAGWQDAHHDGAGGGAHTNDTNTATPHTLEEETPNTNTTATNPNTPTDEVTAIELPCGTILTATGRVDATQLNEMAAGGSSGGYVAPGGGGGDESEEHFECIDMHYYMAELDKLRCRRDRMEIICGQRGALARMRSQADLQTVWLILAVHTSAREGRRQGPSFQGRTFAHGCVYVCAVCVVCQEVREQVQAFQGRILSLRQYDVPALL